MGSENQAVISISISTTVNGFSSQIGPSDTCATPQVAKLPQKVTSLGLHRCHWLEFNKHYMLIIQNSRE